MGKARLAALIGLALVGGLSGQAWADTWSFALSPVGPITGASGRVIHLDMTLSSLSADPVGISPLDHPESSIFTNFGGQTNLAGVPGFFDVFTDLTFTAQDSYSVPAGQTATFPLGDLLLDPNPAAIGRSLTVIATAHPDPLAAGGSQEPPELEFTVLINVVPAPAAGLLLGVGLLATMAWRRLRRSGREATGSAW
jgi:hypothetical protein